MRGSDIMAGRAVYEWSQSEAEALIGTHVISVSDYSNGSLTVPRGTQGKIIGVTQEDGNEVVLILWEKIEFSRLSGRFNRPTEFQENAKVGYLQKGFPMNKGAFGSFVRIAT